MIMKTCEYFYIGDHKLNQGSKTNAAEFLLQQKLSDCEKFEK